MRGTVGGVVVVLPEPGTDDGRMVLWQTSGGRWYTLRSEHGKVVGAVQVLRVALYLSRSTLPVVLLVAPYLRCRAAVAPCL